MKGMSTNWKGVEVEGFQLSGLGLSVFMAFHPRSRNGMVISGCAALSMLTPCGAECNRSPLCLTCAQTVNPKHDAMPPKLSSFLRIQNCENPLQFRTYSSIKGAVGCQTQYTQNQSLRQSPKADEDHHHPSFGRSGCLPGQYHAESV